MIYSCSIVIGPCGVELGIEAADVKSFSMKCDLGDPLAETFIPMNTNEPGGGFLPRFSPIAGIFRMSCKPQIGPAVVESISILMVNKSSLWRIHNFSVQIRCLYPSTYGFFDKTSSIYTTVIANGRPFEMAEAVVNVEVNNRPVALAQIDTAEGVAEFPQAIEQQGACKDKV
ncbi:MAG: hypothetical protein ABSB25_04720 [Sedimentisphaerales bacterium]|jgi:hypothetical protein